MRRRPQKGRCAMTTLTLEEAVNVIDEALYFGTAELGWSHDCHVVLVAGEDRAAMALRGEHPSSLSTGIIAAAEWLQAQATERELEAATVEELEGMLDEAARVNCADNRRDALLAAVREVRKLQGGAA